MLNQRGTYLILIPVLEVQSDFVCGTEHEGVRLDWFPDTDNETVSTESEGLSDGNEIIQGNMINS